MLGRFAPTSSVWVTESFYLFIYHRILMKIATPFIGTNEDSTQILWPLNSRVEKGKVYNQYKMME